jgi:hypothetical protein
MFEFKETRNLFAERKCLKKLLPNKFKKQQIIHKYTHETKFSNCKINGKTNGKKCRQFC